MITITKGQKLQFHSSRQGMLNDGDIFTVSHVGKFKTTLKPQNESEFNPRFQIDTTDLKFAIELNYYTKID